MKTLLGAAVPLFLSMVSGMVAHLVGSAVLGNQSAATLAAMALALAVFSPVAAAVAGGVRGLVPFVAPHADDPAAALPCCATLAGSVTEWAGSGPRSWSVCR
ncbi:hypothetical protein [Nonomuraea recticatena]|uniref:hypothetical protein n=1 Tax=Nonomuraea recticatena TaxID=46178 RepID=UPI00361F0578